MALELGLGGTERQREILEWVRVSKMVRVRELARHFGVHEMTVRRDLDLLAELSRVERVHGGARLLDRPGEEISHVLRASHNLEAKDQMAQSALGLIQDGDVIALDASTSCLALARRLAGVNVRVITPSLEVAQAVVNLGLPLILVGGEFSSSTRSFVGPLVLVTLDRLHPDKVFFSAKAFSVPYGFMDANLPEVESKTALINSGATKVALVDQTKLNRRALVTVAKASEIDVLVTDVPLSENLDHHFQESDVKVIVSGARSRITPGLENDL